jgi:hypothetical protein
VPVIVALLKVAFYYQILALSCGPTLSPASMNGDREDVTRRSQDHNGRYHKTPSRAGCRSDKNPNVVGEMVCEILNPIVAKYPALKPDQLR